MSITQTLETETPPPCSEDIQGILKDIADLLCPAHQHKITDPYILSGDKIRHSMVITCSRESKIVWHVEMSADCLEKVISRCRVVYASNQTDSENIKTGIVDQGRPNMIFEPLATWEGPQCDDILWLLGIGHLEHDWWEYNPSRLSDQRGSNSCWESLANNSPKNRRKIGVAGYGTSGSHNYIANSEPTPNLPLPFPESEGEDFHDGLSDSETDS
ncbi:hypothetical protein HOY82DRAFT_539286 [Tuber indicum]|nr:hypothetical protein HOY82DRAFT_539286 [Tuber indicum]